MEKIVFALAASAKKWAKVCRQKRKRKTIMKGHIKLGVIRLDYDYSAAPGDIDHQDSFDYEVIYRVVPGLTFEMCKSGLLTEDVKHEFIEAATWLQERDVSAITGDCGFMMYFQKLARKHSLTPVFMSSLAQLPAISYAFDQTSKICIFTASLASLQAMKDLIMETIGKGDDREERFVVVGCEDVQGFEAVKKGEKVDLEVVEPGIVNLALKTLKMNPGIKAFLFECTQLSSFSDAVREATGVPVYDAITGCNFFINGFQESARFGKNNWKKTWSGDRKQYSFGQELEVQKKMKLVSLKNRGCLLQC